MPNNLQDLKSLVGNMPDLSNHYLSEICWALLNDIRNEYPSGSPRDPDPVAEAEHLADRLDRLDLLVVALAVLVVRSR